MSRPTFCPHCGTDLQRPAPTEAQRGYLFSTLIEIMRQHHAYPTRREAYEHAVRWLECFPWEEIRPSWANGAIDRDEMAEIIERLSAALILDLQRTVPDPEPDPMKRHLRQAGIEIGASA